MKIAILLLFLESISFNGVHSKPKRQSVKLVICRYTESVDNLKWLESYPNNYEIFNRGDSLKHVEWLNHKHIHHLNANVGRESFIYLDYIFNSYDRLADITIFTQVEKSGVFTHYDFNLIAESLILGEIDIPQENDGFAWIQPHCCFLFADKPFEADFGQEFLGYLKDACPTCRPQTIYYNPTGVFVVKKKNVHRRNKAEYSKWARDVGYQNHPAKGYGFEGLWPLIFSSNCTMTCNNTCILDKSMSCPQDNAPCPTSHEWMSRMPEPCGTGNIGDVTKPYVDTRLEDLIKTKRLQGNQSSSQ